METRDKLYLAFLIVLLCTYIYYMHRIDKRNERFDKELLRGMMIAPPNFSEGKIDDKKSD